jgi:hypothetical protein
MPRPRKTETNAEETFVNLDENKVENLSLDSVEEVVVVEKPEPIVINVPLAQVFQPIAMQSHIVPQSVDRGMLFIANDRGNPVCTVFEDSPKLIEFLDLNKLELEERIQQLKRTVTDEKELVRMNLPFSASGYDSVSQYQVQNGLAPVSPSITNWMEFYKKENYEQTDEEIALRVFGDLRWSFIPTKMAD